MIFNAILGSSGQVPVTPIGGNEMCYALWEWLAFIALTEQIQCSCSLKKVPQVHKYGTVEFCSYCRFLVSPLKLCIASKIHAIPIERNAFHSHQWV